MEVDLHLKLGMTEPATSIFFLQTAFYMELYVLFFMEKFTNADCSTFEAAAAASQVFCTISAGNMV